MSTPDFAKDDHFSGQARPIGIKPIYNLDTGTLDVKEKQEFLQTGQKNTELHGELGGYALTSLTDDVVMSFPSSNSGREIRIDNGEEQVDMNDSAIALMLTGSNGRVVTASLSGCTGIAGFATTSEGTMAGVSHFDPMVDQFHRENRSASMSAEFMYRFQGMARSRGADRIILVAVYDASSTTTPEYGKKPSNFNDWYFIDQLETIAKHAGEDTDVTIIPYAAHTTHGLAAGINGSFAGITFDNTSYPYPEIS